MLSPWCLQRAQDGSDDGAADAHEGDHNDEPAYGDSLVHGDAAAVLARGNRVNQLFVRHERRTS